MAKKKNKKEKRDKSEAASPHADYFARLDAQLARGSYAGVRALLQDAPTDLTADEQAALATYQNHVAIDKVQLALGVGASLLALLAAALTLTTG